VFWVISVYFNIRNTLPKSGTFLLGHPVYDLFSDLLGYITIQSGRWLSVLQRNMLHLSITLKVEAVYSETLVIIS